MPGTGTYFGRAAPDGLDRALAAARPVLRFLDALFRAWGARRLAREIEQWPDERLKDLGLSRAEVAAAVEGLRRPFRWQPDADAARMHPTRFGH